MASPASPLFVAFRKGDHPGSQAIRPVDLAEMVAARAKTVGLDGLTCHGLRATFITLSLENGAPLAATQAQAGHADPRTTMRYNTRRQNLDNAASDYIHL